MLFKAASALRSVTHAHSLAANCLAPIAHPDGANYTFVASVLVTVVWICLPLLAHYALQHTFVE